MGSKLGAESSNLAEGEVHLWWIPIGGSRQAVELHAQALSPDELERAARFHFDVHRNRFLIGRGALRHILGRYLEIEPRDLEFTYGSRGKPDLAPGQNGRGIRFNLSHSHDLGLLAVSMAQELGVDVELVKADFGGMEIAERFFSANEVQTLFALDAVERNAAFFSCWTRKEAFIKAIGEGLSVPLDSFDVIFAPHAKPALTRVEGKPGETLRWKMYDIPAGAQYKAALVIEGQGHRLFYRHWPTEAPDFARAAPP